MKRKGTQAGFTVVELLIVLAVSGVIFVAIATTFSGSQRKTQFLQATQNLQSRLQQVITDVQNGYYPSMDNIQCTSSGTTLSISMVAPPATIPQGTNSGCVFLGKVVQMQIQGTKPERIGTYSIASIRTATDITAAAPSIMAVGTTTEYNNLDYGLVTKSLTYNGGVKAGMFAVVMQMGTLNASGGYESGNQRVDLVPIEGSTLGMPVPSSGNTYNNFTANFINSYKKAAPPQPTRNPTGGILLCVQEDGGGRTALITIGGSGHDLAVKLEVAPC